MTQPSEGASPQSPGYCTKHDLGGLSFASVVDTEGQIVFGALKKIVGLTDEVPWLGVRPLELHAIRPRSAIGEVVSLGILEVEKIVKVLGRGVGEVIVCDKSNGLVA